ncbi:unnamed protein product [marine sediment metagenome]|uniref:Uncharacterized protein n=1 Tax=marine sediment metagenome TaxID=412755 RepID=X1H641_9ZZZZ
MSYSNREVELFQLWAKRAEIERIIALLKVELTEIQDAVRKIAILVNKEKKAAREQKEIPKNG